MNVRGASSKGWPKKQFKFEIWDEEDSDRDVSLLGMPADSDWILHAPYFDRSLMRNALIYNWWGQLGYYSPRTQFVEIFLNPDPTQAFSMDHYRGVYMLTEKIKRSSDRIDITRLEADDVAEPEITGGYVAQRPISIRTGTVERVSGTNTSSPPMTTRSLDKRSGCATLWKRSKIQSMPLISMIPRLVMQSIWMCLRRLTRGVAKLIDKT